MDGEDGSSNASSSVEFIEDDSLADNGDEISMEIGEEQEEELEYEALTRCPCYPPEDFVPPTRREPVPPLSGILDRDLDEIDPRSVNLYLFLKA